MRLSEWFNILVREGKATADFLLLWIDITSSLDRSVSNDVFVNAGLIFFGNFPFQVV